MGTGKIKNKDALASCFAQRVLWTHVCFNSSLAFMRLAGFQQTLEPLEHLHNHYLVPPPLLDRLQALEFIG
jgi:hypothetical protein